MRAFRIVVAVVIGCLMLASTSLTAVFADDGINNGPSDSGWGTGCCW